MDACSVIEVYERREVEDKSRLVRFLVVNRDRTGGRDQVAISWPARDRADRLNERGHGLLRRGGSRDTLCGAASVEPLERRKCAPSALVPGEGPGSSCAEANQLRPK